MSCWSGRQLLSLLNVRQPERLSKWSPVTTPPQCTPARKTNVPRGWTVHCGHHPLARTECKRQMSSLVLPRWQVAPVGLWDRKNSRPQSLSSFSRGNAICEPPCSPSSSIRPFMALTIPFLMRIHKILLVLCAYCIIHGTYNRHS